MIQLRVLKIYPLIVGVIKFNPLTVLGVKVFGEIFFVYCLAVEKPMRKQESGSDTVFTPLQHHIIRERGFNSCIEVQLQCADVLRDCH
jgi:hypothetical protein